ncbi:MAG: hypothetical protein IT518_16500 [Burkholderiales bacterium]|nr:hypothetical protein [Burkholderiales bacterium]
MHHHVRPTKVKVHAALLLLSALVMAAIGWSANAYYLSALCLLVQALLLWRGHSLALFKGILLVNQVSGLALILVLWLGEGLGDAKLDIAGVMLLTNVMTGGPLMSILAVGMLPALHKGRSLFAWFQPAGAMSAAPQAA